MNKTFADHVTSTAFFLSISRKQMDLLLHFEANPWKASDFDRRVGDRRGYYSGVFYDLRNGIATARALEAKGLTSSHPHKFKSGFDGSQAETSYYKLTEAGRLVCALLREAGLAESINRSKAA